MHHLPPDAPSHRRRRLAAGMLLALLGAALISSCAVSVVRPAAVWEVVQATPTPLPAADDQLGPEPVYDIVPLPTAQPTLAPALPVVPRHGVMVVPILMYHYVRVDPNPLDKLGIGLSVTPADFQAQMDYLQAAGVTTITPAQLLTALRTGHRLPPRSVMLTFDDGYSDFATTAAPILLAHHFVAVDYVVSGFIGRLGYMTAAQVKAIDQEGFVVGAHTIHHVSLAKIPLDIATLEIRGSKAALEHLLGHPVPDFAYPYGSLNPDVVTAVGAAGFQDAVTTIGGYQQSVAAPFMWERVEILGTDSLTRFAQKALLLHS